LHIDMQDEASDVTFHYMY